VCCATARRVVPGYAFHRVHHSGPRRLAAAHAHPVDGLCNRDDLPALLWSASEALADRVCGVMGGVHPRTCLPAGLARQRAGLITGTRGRAAALPGLAP
jgi:hypothetical protein